MLKSEIWIILAVIIYVNRSHGRLVISEPEEIETWNNPKIMLIKNITAEHENYLLKFICDDQKDHIKSVKNSTATDLLTRKINTLARWVKNDIANDLNSTVEDILNSLNDVPDDLSTEDAYNETVNVAKTVLSDAVVIWIDDWNARIREIMDMDPDTIANSFSLLNATLVLSLLLEDNVRNILQFSDNKKTKMELLGQEKALHDFTEYERILKRVIDIDFKQKKVSLYRSLFDLINKEIDVKNKFEILYRQTASILEGIRELWKTEWYSTEKLEERANQMVQDLELPKMADVLNLQNITFRESTKKLIKYFSKIDKKFHTEFKAQYEQLKDLDIAAKTVVSCKMHSLQGSQLQDSYEKRRQSLGFQQDGESLPLILFNQKIIEKFNMAVESITKQHMQKLAIIWSGPRKNAFEKFKEFFIHVNNEMLRFIEYINPDNPFFSFDEEEILDFF